MTREIWTVGHVHHSLDDFLRLLRRHRIEKVIDVRSRPHVRFAPQYNHEAFEAALRGAGVDYAWHEVLGQRPYPEDFYDEDGYTLYERVIEQDGFMSAIEEVEDDADARRCALVCLEEDPAECHRYHLLGKLLTDRGATVRHIRREGVAQDQAYIAEMLGENQMSLLEERRSRVWRSPRPMRDKHPSGA